jgi:hypothetical protein
MTSMRPISLLLVAAAALAACSGADAVESATTTTEAPTTTITTVATTTLPPTTTTAAPTANGPISPINGLPVEDETLLDRRALVVKIDNHPNARPQTGLSEADAVVELMVEGTTRLAAVFHAGDAETVGPIRSMRPTDGQLARLFDAPLVTSGGQDWVASLVRDTGTKIIGEVGRPQTFRSGSRSAPHNLYGNTVAIRQLADSREYEDEAPQPLWTFGLMPEDADAAGNVTLPFDSGLVVRWAWDGEKYTKTTNGVSHNWVVPDGEHEQMWAETLVVLEMLTYTQSPPPGGGPAKAVESVGSGKAYVFADGLVTTGTWERNSLGDTFTLMSNGETMAVPPGKLWIGFFDRDQTPSWSE